MLVYKMMCLNRLREYKRLIRNMLLPLLSLLMITGFIGYQTLSVVFPVLKGIEKFSTSIYYSSILFLTLYTGYECFMKVKPAITVKPAAMFFLSENTLSKLIVIKFIGTGLKHFILTLAFTFCINGIHFNSDFLLTLSAFFCILNACCLLQWKIYHTKQKWKDVVIWFLICFPAMLINIHPLAIIAPIGIWLALALFDFLILELNTAKYEEEMRFREKILVAQNYNNTVLLNQYAKEKKVRYLPKSQNVSKLLSRNPLIWKAKTSIYRLSKDLIAIGVVLFGISLSIYKIPLFWSLPFLEQKETRHFLLIGSIFAIFQLTLQSMLKQSDSILEKAKDGLFIPLPEKQIIKQFTAVPVMMIGTESLLLAIIMQNKALQIIIGCIAMTTVTAFIFWLDVKHKALLAKGYFALNIIVFIVSLIISI